MNKITTFVSAFALSTVMISSATAGEVITPLTDIELSASTQATVGLGWLQAQAAALGVSTTVLAVGGFVALGGIRYLIIEGTSGTN